MAARSNLKMSRRRFGNLLRSWIGSNKTSRPQQSMEIPRKRSDARSWLGVHQLMTVTIASPNSLCSIFQHIEEESQRILTKNATARFLDKGEDTKVVVGLIERLRKAIVSYQVGNSPSPLSIADRESRYRNNRQSIVKSPISR